MVGERASADARGRVDSSAIRFDLSPCDHMGCGASSSKPGPPFAAVYKLFDTYCPSTKGQKSRMDKARLALLLQSTLHPVI